jgi:hypothetical protein
MMDARRAARRYNQVGQGRRFWFLRAGTRDI